MKPQEDNLNWFEIPARDIERAARFYETIFGIRMRRQNVKGTEMAIFPARTGNGKAVGGLAKSELHRPNMEGPKIYLNGNPDLSAALDRVEEAGGKVTMPKTKISDELGYMAFFVDTEGNGMALHSSD
jgi:uncharacterized protein